MDNIPVKIKLLSGGVPEYATSGSACADLSARTDAPVTIPPGGICRVPTGVCISLPGPGFAAFVFGRSGLGINHGVTLANGVGVIDSDYTGEIIVGLRNGSSEPYTVNPGDRVAQLCVMPVCRAEFLPADELDATGRGGAGFGSTGK